VWVSFVLKAVEVYFIGVSDDDEVLLVGIVVEVGG
jgi:hypothetical protein